MLHGPAGPYVGQYLASNQRRRRRESCHAAGQVVPNPRPNDPALQHGAAERPTRALSNRLKPQKPTTLMLAACANNWGTPRVESSAVVCRRYRCRWVQSHQRCGRLQPNKVLAVANRVVRTLRITRWFDVGHLTRNNTSKTRPAADLPRQLACQYILRGPLAIGGDFELGEESKSGFKVNLPSVPLPVPAFHRFGTYFERFPISIVHAQLGGLLE
jgi:hypothetical protein